FYFYFCIFFFIFIFWRISFSLLIPYTTLFRSFIDVAIVLLSALLSYVILKGIGIPFVSILHPATALAVFVGVHLVFFWWFQTFNGIVRHSTVTDVAKLFMVETGVFVCLYLINQFVVSTFS